MSREKLEQARERLAQARRDILQDLQALHELAADQSDYTLSQTDQPDYTLSHEEADQIYQAFRDEVDELQADLAQALTIRTLINREIERPGAGPKDYGGPIPPWRWPPDEDQIRWVLRRFSGEAGGRAGPSRSSYGDAGAMGGFSPDDDADDLPPPKAPSIGS